MRRPIGLRRHDGKCLLRAWEYVKLHAGADGSGSPAFPSSDEVRCEGCGATFSDIVRTGKAGCAKCYETFYEQLLPSLQRIHGKTKHTGKVPQSASQQAKKNHHLAQLKEQLNQAVEAQDYEQAAKLRDEIQSLQEEGNQQ